MIKKSSWCRCFGSDDNFAADEVDAVAADLKSVVVPAKLQAHAVVLTASRSSSPEPLSATTASPALLVESESPQVPPSPQADELALHDAARANKVQLLHKLVHEQGVSVNAQDEQKRTALHIAIAAGSIAAVNKLIQLGAEVDAMDEMGRTPFLAGASGPTADGLAMLRAANANIFARDQDGNTALHLACGNGNIPVVKYLLEIGADVHSMNKDAQTPLHKAAEQDEFEVVNRLVWGGAVVDAPDQIGNTPLHIAARLGNVSVARYLIRNHANLCAVNKSKKSPCDVALDEEMRKMLTDMELAESHGRSGGHPKAPSSILASVANSVTYSVEYPRTPGKESAMEGRCGGDGHSILSLDDASMDLSIREGSTATTNTSTTQGRSSTHSMCMIDSFVHPRDMDVLSSLTNVSYVQDPSLRDFSPLNTTPSTINPFPPNHPSSSRSSKSKSGTFKSGARISGTGSSPNSPLLSTSPAPSTRTGHSITRPSRPSTQIVRSASPSLRNSTDGASLKLSIPEHGAKNFSLRPSSRSRDRPHSSIRATTPASSRISTSTTSQYSAQTLVSHNSGQDRSPLPSARSKASSMPDSIRTPTSTTSAPQAHTQEDILPPHLSNVTDSMTYVSDSATYVKPGPKAGHRTHPPAKTQHGHSLPRDNLRGSQPRPMDILEEDDLQDDTVSQVDQLKPTETNIRTHTIHNASTPRHAKMDKLETMSHASYRTTRSRVSYASGRSSLRGRSGSPLRGKDGRRVGVRPPGIWLP